MKKLIQVEINRLCKKAFDKSRSKVETREKYQEKFARRTGITSSSIWPVGQTFVHRHYDPTFCKRHASFLASGIWNSVLEGRYEPTPSIQYRIPKPAGGFREVMSFSIPDAALANVILRAARSRNLKRLSPYSYAYHPSRNVFDAILSLKDFDTEGKLFSVQIDFEKYFDSIPKKYLQKKIDDINTLSLTPHERHVFRAFLDHQYGNQLDFWKSEFRRRHRGTPQGSSVSLLLANLANHDLDRQLGKEAGKFVRFADDVVAFCTRYEDALRLESCFERHCENSGISINRQKSPGIALVSSQPQELRSTDEFTYLGYSFSAEGLKFPEKAIKKLRSKVSRLINIYLLNALKYGYNPSRADRNLSYDWDLLGLICELRRSIYGGLRESDIQEFLSSGTELRAMRGLMGFYCLLEDRNRLREFDGWMVNAVRRAQKTRQGILAARYGADCPTPNNRQLILGTWLGPVFQDESGANVEVLFPSLVRGWRAARKHFLTFGLESVSAPQYQSSGDVSALFDFY